MVLLDVVPAYDGGDGGRSWSKKPNGNTTVAIMAPVRTCGMNTIRLRIGNGIRSEFRRTD